MASVRVEEEAFGDERYDDLAHFAGLADADHARGKMLRIWRQCTIEQTNELSEVMVSRILGTRGPEAIVLARLADKIDNPLEGVSTFRIHGCEGRIEWLGRLRKNARFGKLGAKHGKKGGRPKKIRNPLEGVSENPPLAPALAPVLSSSYEEDRSRVRALAAMLLDRTIANHPNTRTVKRAIGGGREGIIAGWSKPIAALHADGIAYDDIERGIEWCTRDDYWRGIVISAVALRRSWDTITAQMSRPKRTSGQHTNGSHRDANGIDLIGPARMENRDYSLDGDPFADPVEDWWTKR